LGKAFLEHVDAILDDGEVDKGYLEDVDGQIAFEDALPGVVLVLVIDVELLDRIWTYLVRVLIRLPRASRYASRARSSKPNRTTHTTCCLTDVNQLLFSTNCLVRMLANFAARSLTLKVTTAFAISLPLIFFASSFIFSTLLTALLKC
jgi:hypothetical protein